MALSAASGTSDGPRRASGPRRTAQIAVVGVSLVAHAVVLVPFIAASGLVAPLWAIALLFGVWLVGARVLWGLARHRPLATPLVPAATLAVWWLTLTLGGHLLGWSA